MVLVAQGNGKVPTAHARAKALGKEIDAAENTLATAIGQAVAAELGKLFQPVVQMVPQLAQVASGQKMACVYCAARAKIAEHKYAQALAAAELEYQIVCQAASDLNDTPPEFVAPVAERVPIQEAFTLLPVVVMPGMPPCSVPVCYDDLPTEPAQAAAEEEPEPPKAPYRPVGLVDVAGRQILAPNE